jgi:hypothetical protein
MKVFSVLFCLFICASVQASQGFYRENIINPANPLSVLDPAKRPEIERLAQNLRFFGHLGARPASDIYVHYQAIQNLLVYPTSPVTALSWMLFPISPLPTINPNNIGVSDPLGKMAPEQLGELIAVIANGNAQLQEIYPIFVAPRKVAGFVTSHNETDLKEFHRYALIDGVSKYVHRNMTPIDEDLHLTEEQQAEYATLPHLLVTAAFKSTSSHLLEIPGTEILREAGETWFTQAELEAGLQELPMPVKDRKIYKKFSDQGRVKFRIQATVDMLWKSAQNAPNETLQLLTHYAWRKFGDQIDKVLLASGAIDEAHRPELMHILATPFTKADYQAIVAGVQASEDIDSFMDGLTVGESNLLLYGGARYAQIRFQDYGNVMVEHAGRALAFANCGEMSLFNLTHLAQLEEQEMGLERNPAKLLEDSPLRTFWETLDEEDLSTTATRNRWTQTICRLNGVVYRKGGAQRSPWTEDSATTHWAELNPGILNQMRTLFHLLNKPEEAAALTYAGSTETTIEVAALRLSQLLSGEPADGELSFEITPSEIKNLPGKKDWYGIFDIIRNGEKLADWYVDANHSFLKLISKKVDIFPLDKPFTDPYVIGQLEVPERSWDASEEVQAAYALAHSQFTQKIESLKTNPQVFETFFTHAKLYDEQFRESLARWCISENSTVFHPLAHKIQWGMLQVDEGSEVSRLIFDSQQNGNSAFLTHKSTKKLISFIYKSHFQNQEEYSQACMNYAKAFQLNVGVNLQPANRCERLYFDILSALPPVSPDDILAEHAEEILSRTIFPRLRGINCSFDKDCSEEYVARIAGFLPAQHLDINIGKPISPDHFYAFVRNTNEDKTYYLNEGSLSSWGCRFVDVPATQQEYVYDLLLPLAKAGQPFEPPFIELHTDEDLEPVYAQLRTVATYAQMPFAEDEEA